MIQVYDNLFDIKTVNQIYEECKSLTYVIGETDIPTHPPTGQIVELEQHSPMVQIINEKVQHFVSLYNYKMHRAYSNKFLPGENPYFHIDGARSLTAIYYCNTEIGFKNISKLDEGGETQFYNKDRDEVFGVLPYTGRLIIFDGELYHRGTSFRTLDRYNIVIKYK